MNTAVPTNPPTRPGQYWITDFGAIGDGAAMNTQAIQAALDAAGAAGGGVVMVPPGVWLCGTIWLRSFVTLELMTGAVLKASTDIADYPVHKHWDDEARAPFVNPDLQPHSFLFAEEVEHITIQGGGTIQLPGEAFWDLAATGPSGWIPYKLPRVSPSICFKHCTEVRLLDIAILDSSGWTVEMNSCRYVWIRGLRIENHFFGPNTDGLDIQGCQDVMISDCRIDVSDDCIVLKTLPDTPPNERITVTNCTLRTQCVGLKCGANESFGDMRQITFTNCVVHDTTRAFGLYAYCGGHYEDIVVSNIVCDTKNDYPLNRPIHIDVRDKMDDGKAKHTYAAKAGSIRNVQVSNCVFRTDGRILITCQEGASLENVVLRDIRMEMTGVDDPSEKGRTAKSGQWSMANPDCGAARGVVAAENVRGLVVRDLYVHWPAENAGPDFAVVWGKSLRGGLLDAPLASPKGSAPKYDLTDSTIRVVD